MIAKRIFDILSSGIGLIILLPFFLLIAFWIKLDSPGPVFFRQARVGRHGKLFRIYKFRTMIADAELRGRLITIGEDCRITRIGSFLRRYKLDELPQLINVFIGDMSLVGPRPEVPRYVALYSDKVRERVLSVRPGITDYASIEYKDENDILGNSVDPEKTYIDEVIPVKLTYYERYVSERSFFNDIKIIFSTLKAIVIK